jgi:hypothetical protein
LTGFFAGFVAACGFANIVFFFGAGAFVVLTFFTNRFAGFAGFTDFLGAAFFGEILTAGFFFAFAIAFTGFLGAIFFFTTFL